MEMSMMTEPLHHSRSLGSQGSLDNDKVILVWEAQASLLAETATEVVQKIYRYIFPAH